jgi:hypothetical protein
VARRTLHTPHALGAGSAGVRSCPSRGPCCRPSLERHGQLLAEARPVHLVSSTSPSWSASTRARKLVPRQPTFALSGTPWDRLGFNPLHTCIDVDRSQHLLRRFASDGQGRCHLLGAHLSRHVELSGVGLVAPDADVLAIRAKPLEGVHDGLVQRSMCNDEIHCDPAVPSRARVAAADTSGTVSTRAVSPAGAPLPAHGRLFHSPPRCHPAGIPAVHRQPRCRRGCASP